VLDYKEDENCSSTKIDFTDKLLTFLIKESRMIRSKIGHINNACRVMRKFKPHIIRDILEKYRSQHISLKKIRALYNEEDPSFYFSTETLRKYMTKHLNVFYKKPIVRHHYALLNKNYVQRSIYLRKICDLLRNEEHVLFFDECRFYNKHGRTKLWTSLNDNKMIGMCTRMKSIELLFICDNRGFYKYMIVDGRLNSAKLMRFFNFVLTEVKKNDYLTEMLNKKKLWIYMDNHLVHHAKQLKRMILHSGGNVLFPATYRPEYNLAEYAFAVLKKRFY
jgi:hypothetical protein